MASEAFTEGPELDPEGQVGCLYWRQEGNLIEDPEVEKSRPNALGKESSSSRNSGAKDKTDNFRQDFGGF